MHLGEGGRDVARLLDRRDGQTPERTGDLEEARRCRAHDGKRLGADGTAECLAIDEEGRGIGRQRRLPVRWPAALAHD
jgi:hypothetical protein